MRTRQRLGRCEPRAEGTFPGRGRGEGPLTPWAQLEGQPWSHPLDDFIQQQVKYVV